MTNHSAAAHTTKKSIEYICKSLPYTFFFSSSSSCTFFARGTGGSFIGASSSVSSLRGTRLSSVAVTYDTRGGPAARTVKRHTAASKVFADQSRDENREIHPTGRAARGRHRPRNEKAPS